MTTMGKRSRHLAVREVHETIQLWNVILYLSKAQSNGRAWVHHYIVLAHSDNFAKALAIAHWGGDISLIVRIDITPSGPVAIKESYVRGVTAGKSEKPIAWTELPAKRTITEAAEILKRDASYKTSSRRIRRDDNGKRIHEK